MSIGAAIFARLNADATLTALLGTYASAPCVFYPHVPADAPRPYVVIDPPLASPITLQTMKGDDVRAPECQVHAFVDFTGSSIAVDAIGARLFDLLHSNGVHAGLSSAVAITGYNGVLTSVISGPDDAQTDDSLEGRTLTVRATIGRS